MTTSLHDVSVRSFINGLRSLGLFLEKGRLYADETGLDHADLLGSRLEADMMSLKQQVQRASDTAKIACVRVAGVENVPMPDSEETFADLQQRIAATVAFLETVPREAMDAHADAELPWKTTLTSRSFTGRSYILEFSVPNFFFHITTAYALLRHAGVPLGKIDYLGWR
ncbi:MAG TPA: DUF1993 domain-containing protein [Acidisoma sp.]|uniref:DUF1993 domain-containing protein n=1 Tax=Acidisoma sp. TaxID=1872115 RepID=UPI002C86131D|nr:DUF1993 domain-containing protein [Acidisoma sp.]HTH99318.1 DUF1993 domain-containing protein [Acidisoma sp.]